MIEELNQSFGDMSRLDYMFINNEISKVVKILTDENILPLAELISFGF